MNEFETTGRHWLRGVLDDTSLELPDAASVSATLGQRVKFDPKLSSVLGPGGPVVRALSAFLPNAIPTRLVSFDKTAATNWGVPWHQDRVIAVASPEQVDGYKNWSDKEGIIHCEPPLSILEKMLFLRVHLDDETEQTGPMQIALGSHRAGSVHSEHAKAVAEQHQVETCLGKRGDILVLKMLTLHRSLSATDPTSRRVLRVDYANSDLPDPLEWRGAI